MDNKDLINATKEMVIALINNNQICRRGDPAENIQDVQKAIKEIYQTLVDTQSIQIKVEVKE